MYFSQTLTISLRSSTNGLYGTQFLLALKYMKKVFSLVHATKKPARLVEASKNVITKYLKRERRKQLPEGVDFVDFKCRLGSCEEVAAPIHINELFKGIDRLEKNQASEFYVEILPFHGVRQKKK